MSWTPHGIHIERILQDNEHFDCVKPKLDALIVNCILPLVLCGPTKDAHATKENVPTNQNDDVYCYCRRGEYGKMVVCDNPHCRGVVSL